MRSVTQKDIWTKVVMRRIVHVNRSRTLIEQHT